MAKAQKRNVEWLVGQSLTGVHYFESEGMRDATLKFDDRGWHSAGHELLLKTTSADHLVLWNFHKGECVLELRSGTVHADLWKGISASQVPIEVSGHPRWNRLLHKPVEEVSVHSWVSELGGEFVDAALRIVVGGEVVWVALGILSGDAAMSLSMKNPLQFGSTGLVVLFGDAAAHDTGLSKLINFERSLRRRVLRRLQQERTNVNPYEPLSPQDVDVFRRDVVFVYDYLADYRSIMGDLDWDLLNKPYWRALQSGMRPDDVDFLRSGCLMVLLARAWEVLDGSGYPSSTWPDSDMMHALQSASCEGDLERLRQAAVAAISVAHEVGSDYDKTDHCESLQAESFWAHERFVQAYYLRRAESFQRKPLG